MIGTIQPPLSVPSEYIPEMVETYPVTLITQNILCCLFRQQGASRYRYVTSPISPLRHPSSFSPNKATAILIRVEATLLYYTLIPEFLNRACPSFSPSVSECCYTTHERPCLPISAIWFLHPRNQAVCTSRFSMI